MIKGKYTENSIYRMLTRAAALMLIAVTAAAFIPLRCSYAASSDDPVREVHKVKVGSEKYCVFVKSTVVLTPDNIAGMTDNELVDEVVDQAGVYMKETNCKKPSHKPITAAAWVKSGGSFRLADADIESIRNAAPEDGYPVKLYMDLGISTDPAPRETDDESAEEGEEAQEDIDDDVYYTRKLLSPQLLYVVIASDSDSKSSEDICKEPETKTKKTKKHSGSSSEDKDMLPELRTISMTDRSGEPLEPTLQDGDPVELEWIDPGKHPGSREDVPFFETVRGKILIIALAAVIIAGVALAAAAMRKKRKAGGRRSI